MRVFRCAGCNDIVLVALDEADQADLPGKLEVHERKHAELEQMLEGR